MSHDLHDFEEKLWKALRSDRTVMLGINGVDESHTRPMTAQFEQERGPIWFFTSTDNAMVQTLGSGEARAVATFAAKGHDLFATIHGTLCVDTWVNPRRACMVQALPGHKTCETFPNQQETPNAFRATANY
jgi:general stress protein 26